RPRVERLLQTGRVKYELRTVSQEKLWYDVHVPVGRKTERLSEQILDLDREHGAVQWEEKKEKRELPVVAELKGDAEVVLAQGVHRDLQFVLRRRRDADLIGLNRRLHFLQFLVLAELHDFARGLDWNALLNRDDAADRAAGRRFARRRLEVLDRHA